MNTDAWFNPNLYAWIPGTALGVFGGLLGAVSGVCASRGTAKGLVFGLWGLMALGSVGLLVAAAVAYFDRQPYGVWYPLALPGFVGTIMTVCIGPLFRQRYALAEQRKMAAKDL